MNGVTSTDSRENSPLVPILIPSSPSPRLRREYRKVLHPLTGDTEDGYSVHTPTPPIHYPPPPVTPDDHEELTGKSSLPDSFSSANIHRKGVESLRSGSQSPPASIIDNSASGGISRRPGSRFSGLSLLETITEQKSNSTMRKRRDSIGNSGSENSEISGISERTSPGEETCLLGGGGEKDCEDGSEDIEKLCFFRDFSDTASPLCPSLPLGDAPLFTESTTTCTPSICPSPNIHFSRNNPTPRQLPGLLPPISINCSYESLSSHQPHRTPILAKYPLGATKYDPHQRTTGNPTNRSRARSSRQSEIWRKIGRGICLVCCCFSVADTDL